MQQNNSQIVDQLQPIVCKIGCTTISTISSDCQSILDQSTREMMNLASWQIKYNKQWAQIFIQMLETQCQSLQVTPRQSEDMKFITKTLPLVIVHISFPNLVQLSLRDLNIGSIESLAFLDMDNLQELDLANNKITSIKPLNKQKWEDLDDLNLNRNKMRQIDIYRTKLSSKIQFLNYDHFTYNNFYGIKNQIQVDDVSKVVKLQSSHIRSYKLSQVMTYLEQPQICKKIKDRFPKIDLLTQNEFMMWT